MLFEITLSDIKKHSIDLNMKKTWAELNLYTKIIIILKF